MSIIPTIKNPKLYKLIKLGKVASKYNQHDNKKYFSKLLRKFQERRKILKFNLKDINGELSMIIKSMYSLK